MEGLDPQRRELLEARIFGKVKIWERLSPQLLLNTVWDVLVLLRFLYILCQLCLIKIAPLDPFLVEFQ